MEYINQIDHSVTIYLNSLHTPFWDSIMTFVSNKYVWFPLYAAIIAFLIILHKKKGVFKTLTFLVMVLFIEICSSWVSKPYFERYRPCKDPVVSQQIRSIGCRSQYGFFSGHSSQSFGIAMLAILFLKKRSKWFYLGLIWAGIVAYSRIYLGVHYLGDVLFGAIFGISSAFLFQALYKKLEKRTAL